MKHRALVAMLAGILLVLAANIALLININAGLDACFPYWDGCLSVSRAVRSGPGLMILKILAWPAAALMIYCWYLSGNWITRQNPSGENLEKPIVWMGMLGAVFFVVYASYFGTDGEIYRWLRRYGVVFYFGLTALAQLIFASSLWNIRKKTQHSLPGWPVNLYLGIIFVSCILGVGSAFKRTLIENPVLQDRVENLLEWNFALMMSLAFVALGLVIRSDKPVTEEEKP